MYDCDKGFILGERGPPGATCVGGLWRPTELPSCIPGLHPRIRWSTRRKRSLQIRAARSQYLLRNIRQLQRKLAELLTDLSSVPNHLNTRSKRSANFNRELAFDQSNLWSSLSHRSKRPWSSEHHINPNRKELCKRMSSKRMNKMLVVSLYNNNEFTIYHFLQTKFNA